MGEFSLTHWLIILVILLLFFGPSKLPGLGASLGKAIRGFKSGLNEADPNQPPTANQGQSPRPPEQLSGGSVGDSHVGTTTQNEKAKDPNKV